MDILNSLTIDYDNNSGWYNIVCSIIDETSKCYLPDEAFMYVYEKSLCSGCRKYAVEEMEKRGMLTENIIFECKFDSNSEIRDIAKKYLD